MNMAKKMEWYSGSYQISWNGERDPKLPGSDLADGYDLKLSEGGVVFLRSKGGTGLYVCAPHTWSVVRLPGEPGQCNAFFQHIR
jgi:hypothetical protein